MFAAGHTHRLHQTAAAKAQTPKGHPARCYDFIATTENGQDGLRCWRIA